MDLENPKLNVVEQMDHEERDGKPFLYRWMRMTSSHKPEFHKNLFGPLSLFGYHPSTLSGVGVYWMTVQFCWLALYSRQSTEAVRVCSTKTALAEEMQKDSCRHLFSPSEEAPLFFCNCI